MINEASNTDELVRVIGDIVKAELSSVEVVSVDVERDEDHDGDPILRVRIVVDLSSGNVEPSRMRGLARHLREPLERIGQFGFPVFSVLSTEEVAGAAA